MFLLTKYCTLQYACLLAGYSSGMATLLLLAQKKGDVFLPLSPSSFVDPPYLHSLPSPYNSFFPLIPPFLQFLSSFNSFPFFPPCKSSILQFYNSTILRFYNSTIPDFPAVANVPFPALLQYTHLNTHTHAYTYLCSNDTFGYTAVRQQGDPV